MEIHELKELVFGGESVHVEFKRSTGQRTEAAKTACGMLNGLGGLVLLGVTDIGKLAGQQMGADTLGDIAAELRRIEPPAFPDLGTINIIDWCAENANPAPAWQEEAGSVYITFLPADLPDIPQVTPEITGEVTPQVVDTLTAAHSSRSLTELQQKIGLKDRVHFLKAYLKPLLVAGWLERTIPDKPRSSKQKCRLTKKG